MTADAAVTWGTALRATMARQRVPVGSLAAAVGMHTSGISDLRNGHRFPSMSVAVRISEALAAPKLLELCASLRTQTCAECGRQFVNDQRGGSPAKWCGKRCRDLGRWRATRQESDDRRPLETFRAVKRAQRWERMAVERQAAIDAMCLGCEPSGACRQSDCPLRAVSPLPLVGDMPVSVAATGRVRLPDGPLAERRRRESKAAWARQRRAAVA